MPPTESYDKIRTRVLALFAAPPLSFHACVVDVPCGPGRICARIEYDEEGAVLDSVYKRQEFALAMEERIGAPLSDDALAAYSRRLCHLWGADEANVTMPGGAP
jgi:hypothetical protein